MPKEPTPFQNHSDKVFPVYVATCGRAEDRYTLDQLDEHNIPHVAVVEPREEKLYKKTTKSLLVLPKDNKGLWYVRQWILDHANKLGLEWFWMLDDDIKKFYRVENAKCIPVTVRECLLDSQRWFVNQKTCGQAALEYQQFGWGAKKPFAINSYCDVAVCIHAKRCSKIKFRKETDLKVDRDFTLQVIASGMHAIRTTHCCFSAPKNASNKGGLQEAYLEGGREEASSKMMVEIWGPDVCKFFKKPDGRPDVKINWKFTEAK